MKSERPDLPLTIARLVRSATPVTPLARPSVRLARWAITSTALALVSVAILGVRSDVAAQMMNGWFAWPATIARGTLLHIIVENGGIWPRYARIRLQRRIRQHRSAEIFEGLWRLRSDLGRRRPGTSTRLLSSKDLGLRSGRRAGHRVPALMWRVLGRSRILQHRLRPVVRDESVDDMNVSADLAIPARRHAWIEGAGVARVVSAGSATQHQVARRDGARPAR